MPNEVSVRWAARREGNNGYVKEVRSDGTEQIFGPITAHAVPAFIEGRRKLIEYMLQQKGATIVRDSAKRNPFLEAAGGSGGGGAPKASIPRNEDKGKDLEPWDEPGDPIDYIQHGKEE